MNVLIIGSGGREHALAWRLVADGSADSVFVAPGNGGIDVKQRVNLAINDFPGILSCCKEKRIDLVVVGPEAPLVDGLVNYLNAMKIPVFGPSKEAALLEGSKLFAKRIMETYRIPTAWHRDFVGPSELLKYIDGTEDYPIVIKLDGLAAGKGVALPQNREEAYAFVREQVTDSTKVFVEEYLEGEEASVLGLSDGTTVIPFIAAQDHKRAFDDDRGPNTGGMGAYAPAPIMTSERLALVQRDILQPTIDGMRAEGMPFKGILYAGLMVMKERIMVLEYNVRFGDPEAQVILPLMKGRLGDAFEKSITGTLCPADLSFTDQHAITVVMAAGGYPGAYTKGAEIQGLRELSEKVMIFHAGTVEQDGKCYTNGGRVLNVTAMGKNLNEARNAVYGEIDRISFDGGFYRSDIGHRALNGNCIK